MSDKARVEAAAVVIDGSFDDVALGWSQAERMEFAQRIAKVALAAADAAGDTVTVSRDDLRAVLDGFGNEDPIDAEREAYGRVWDIVHPSTSDGEAN